MARAEKQIPVSELRRGMFVSGVFDKNGAFIYTAGMRIASRAQIDSLRRQGARTVVIVPDQAEKNEVEELFSVSIEDELAEAAREGGKRDTGIRGAGREMRSTEMEPPAAFRAEPEADEATSAAKTASFAEYQEKLRKGHETVAGAHTAIRDALDSVRMGRVFLSRKVMAATEKLVCEVLGDPDVYFGLSLVKSLGDYIYTHSVNVAILSAAFAGALGYTPGRARDVAIGAILHDVGMMKLPQDLWFRHGNFTQAEFADFCRHPALGIELLESNRQKMPAASRSVVAQHHERWNGSGFPGGLKRLEINEAALICSLADTYDQLTTKTPYHHASLPQEALAAIFCQAEKCCPRLLTEQFTRLMGVYPVGSFVKLSGGEKGLVIRINRTSLLLPAVLVLFDYKGNRLAAPFVRDLAQEAMGSGAGRLAVERSLNPVGHSINPAEIFSIASV